MVTNPVTSRKSKTLVPKSDMSYHTVEGKHVANKTKLKMNNEVFNCLMLFDFLMFAGRLSLLNLKKPGKIFFLTKPLIFFASILVGSNCLYFIRKVGFSDHQFEVTCVLLFVLLLLMLSRFFKHNIFGRSKEFKPSIIILLMTLLVMFPTPYREIMTSAPSEVSFPPEVSKYFWASITASTYEKITFNVWGGCASDRLEQTLDILHNPGMSS